MDGGTFSIHHPPYGSANQLCAFGKQDGGQDRHRRGEAHRQEGDQRRNGTSFPKSTVDQKDTHGGRYYLSATLAYRHPADTHLGGYANGGIAADDRQEWHRPLEESQRHRLHACRAVHRTQIDFDRTYCREVHQRPAQTSERNRQYGGKACLPATQRAVADWYRSDQNTLL